MVDLLKHDFFQPMKNPHMRSKFTLSHCFAGLRFPPNEPTLLWHVPSPSMESEANLTMALWIMQLIYCFNKNLNTNIYVG